MEDLEEKYNKKTGLGQFVCGLSLEGVEKVQADLKSIEDSLDRIIEKYEKVESFAAQHKSNNIINRQLTDYEKEKIDNLNSKYYLKPCKGTVKELKQDLIKLFKDEQFLWGSTNKLEEINNIFNQFVLDPNLFDKEKITLEDL